MHSKTENIIITGTIVLYQNDINTLKESVESFLKVPLSKKLFLIDNSPTNKLGNVFNSDEIEYVFLNRNIGFGSAHNMVLDKIKNSSKYHLVLNPDVKFEPNVIPNLIDALSNNNSIGMIAPKVIYPNGEHQYSCRRYPSFLELIVRRLPLKKIFNTIIKKGEYRDRDLNASFFSEYISGCFQLYKTQDFIKINGFDQRYFMYMEDVDICKKLDLINKKKLYYPKEEIIHKFEKGSAKKIKLLLYHIKSIIQYFYKWKIAN